MGKASGITRSNSMLRGHAPSYVRFCCYSIPTLYMEMQACFNFFLSRICLLKAVCNRFLPAKTLKERSGDSHLWMKH